MADMVEAGINPAPKRRWFAFRSLQEAALAILAFIGAVILLWLAWRPLIVAAVGALIGMALRRRRDVRGITTSGIAGASAALILYPLSLGPVAFLVWNGWFGVPQSVLQFYQPFFEAARGEPYQSLYEYYMCFWLDVDSASLWFWTNEVWGDYSGNS